MRVNIFKSVKASWPQETELDAIVQMMRTSPKIHIWTQTYRQYVAKGDKMGAEQTKLKCFPAFAPCALFYEGKARDNVLGLTDLCFLDIDHIKEERLIEEAMDILRNDPYVMMASRSVSNEGLHILIRYQLKALETPPQRTTMSPDDMQGVYADVYDYFATMYQQKLGLESDYNARDMGHLYIVSYDPDLYYNPNAETAFIDPNELLSNAEDKPIKNIGAKIREAEGRISKCHLDEAVTILQECNQWIVEITSNSLEAPKQDLSSLLRKLEENLAELKKVMDVKGRVDELMNEVDENLRNRDIKTAHEKIMEAQKMLKKTTGPFNNAITKIRKGVVKREMRMGALNRDIRREAYEKRLQEEGND